MKKKLLVALLSLAMALSFTMVPAFAVEKPTVTVETAATAVEVGAKVVLRVSIKDNPGFTNFEWNIRYDKARLELTAIDSELDIVGNTNHSQTGFGYATYARANSYTKNTDLFTLTFTVKADAAAGNAEVTIESNNFKNIGVAIDADYVAGGVTVNGTTGGSTTGGNTTGGSTTGGSTTGGSTTGGSTTGGSTTGGNTTGGSTTGGSTTGGSTTGGSTTGGSTTGGSTTGGSTTGGSTTGGSTTGGSTTGGSTTGGSTTGGSTTGGGTTGGSTTGGGTTGGGTTGGGSTGGGTTGGGSTGGGSSSGSGSSYTSGMSFTTDLPADSITRVTVNGKKLDSKYYTVSSNGSGSIVTLTDAYLATLKAGTYTIKIESATHVSTGTFTIKADGTPKTADAGIALYAVMAVSSLMGTAVVSKKCRKA